MSTRRGADGADWTGAWAERYGSTRADRLGSAGGRAKVAVLAGALLGLAAAPLAVGQGGGAAGGPQAGASATGSVIREGVRNPTRGAATRETQVISRVTGNRFGTRQSNISTGANAGGAAVYGCRRPTRECTRHVNLAGGPAAHFAVRGEGAVPFTLDPNATGLVEGLNAERVGGLTAAELQGQTGPPGPPGPPGPSTGPAGGALTGAYPDPQIAASAVGYANLDDDVRPRWALVAANGALVAGRGVVNVLTPADLGDDGRYRVVFDREIEGDACGYFVSNANEEPVFVTALPEDDGLNVETYAVDDPDLNVDSEFSVLVLC